MNAIRKGTAALLLAAAVGGCGGSTVTVTVTRPATTAQAPAGATTTPTTPATSTTSQTAPTPTTTTTVAPTATVHEATFASPSRNIGCMIIDATARCDIKQRTWSPPPTPKSCPPVVDYGQGLTVGTTGPGRLVCAGDTVLDPAAPTLAYGTATQVGSFLCVSRTTGMTCTETTTGHGFFISIQSYRIF